MSILGTRVVRTEDPRLLTAGGTYTDDLRLPELIGAARVTFVRSPVAHARITGIDTTAARAAPGVLAVLTAADLDDLPPGDGSPTAEPLLATDRVRYVGEAVAIVVTEDGYQGADAAELVSVDYDPLPAVTSISAALAGGPRLFDGTESNVAASGGEPPAAGAFRDCDVVIERTIGNQRLAPVPLEVRAAAARWADGRLTLWASTQNAQLARDAVAGAGPGTGRGPGRRPRRGRRVRCKDRHRAGHDHGGLGRETAGPAAALGGDPEREPDRHGARPGPAADDQDWRDPGRPHPRLPPGRRPGLRGLSAVRCVPGRADPADGQRRV